MAPSHTMQLVGRAGGRLCQLASHLAFEEADALPGIATSLALPGASPEARKQVLSRLLAARLRRRTVWLPCCASSTPSL